MKTKQCLVIVMTLLCLCVKAQNLRVTGVVRDKSDVIIGASVMVKNSTVGTVTDMDGRYSVEVPANGVLIFSYIGYTPVEKQVDGQTVINVTMNDDVQAIDEVVVTAIGIKQQKKKLGYTTQQVNTEALDQPGTVNVGNALSGQVAGLTVNNPTGIFQAPSFSLRGKTPLMVIDGVPVESDLFDVSPENIESINVLKGTAAAALYGSRGKDGAILITTKLAKEDGLTVTAGLSSMVSAGFTVFPETQTEFGSGSNGQYAFWDGADGAIQKLCYGQCAVHADPRGVQRVEIALPQVFGVCRGGDAHHAHPVSVGAAGGDVGVIDLFPAGAGEVVFIACHAVGVLGHAADSGVFQMYDDGPPGLQLFIQAGKAAGKGAAVSVVPGGRPYRTVRPHPAA